MNTNTISQIKDIIQNSGAYGQLVTREWVEIFGVIGIAALFIVFAVVAWRWSRRQEGGFDDDDNRLLGQIGAWISGVIGMLVLWAGIVDAVALYTAPLAVVLKSLIKR